MCYVMQKKPNIIEEKALSLYFNLEGYTLAHPIISSNSILYLYSNYSDEATATLLPSFTSPELMITNENEKYKISKEFLFYSRSLNEEFIVHLRVTDNYPRSICLDFYRTNGEFVYTKEKEVEGLERNYYYTSQEMEHEYDSSEVKISQNGRFLYYITKENNENYQYNPPSSMNDSAIEDSKKKAKKKKKGERKFYPEGSKNLTAHVYEIVLVRKKSLHNHLNGLVSPIKESRKISNKKSFKSRAKKAMSHFDPAKKVKKEKERKRVDKVMTKIKGSKIQFELKKVRTFEQVEKYFGTSYDPILTDLGSFALFNPDEKRIFYEEKEFTDYVEKQLGEDDTLRKYSIEDYKWKVLKTGFLGYREDRMYYLNLKISMDKKDSEFTVNTDYSKIIPMSFILGEGDISIQSVYGCIDPTKVTFLLKSSVEESIYLVWSLESNTEIRNFSIKGEGFYAHGSGSQSGYVFSQNGYYVNLDHGIPNYFFDRNFSIYDLKSPNGFKMDKSEHMMLINGSVILKAEYIHVDMINNLLRYPDSLTESNFNSEYGKFEFQGNTIFHLFALEADLLAIMIDYFVENYIEGLYGLLIRNNEGKTPIDISMERNSTKSTDILIRGLTHMEDGNYSGQLYKIFPKLVIKGLKSFHDYVDTCTFQTLQMKNMKYLSLRKANADQVCAAHSSCLLDRHFLEKHTVAEKQKKEYFEKRKDLRLNYIKLNNEKKKLQKEQNTLKQSKFKSHLPAGGDVANVEDIKLIDTAKVGGSYSEEIKEVKGEFEDEVNNDKESSERNDSEDNEEYSYEDEDDEDEEEESSELAVTYNQPEVSSPTKDKILKTSDPFSNGDQLFGGTFDQKGKQHHARTEHDIEDDLKKVTEEEKRLKIKEKKIEKEHKKQQRDLKKGLKRYDIKACEFDWLFNDKEGKDFLYALSETENIEIFSLPLISNIILFLWGYYRTQIVIQVLIPFLLYFIVFLLYATWINSEDKKEDGKTGDPYHDANIAMLISIILGI